MDNLISELESFGLTNKEAKIYISNLKLGDAKVSEISKDAGILRETTYFVLESLLKKGFVSYFMRRKIKYFSAADPKIILNFFKEKERKFGKVIPKLDEIKKTINEKPKSEIFNGKEGIKSIIEDIIQTKSDINCLSSTSSLAEKLEFYFPNYIKRRIESQIAIKLVTERTEETKKLKINDKREVRETKFFSKKYDFPNAVFIYGNKVALIDLSENLNGFLIEDKNLSETFKVIFQIIWDKSVN